MELASGSCRSLVLEICHQHGSSFKIDHTVTACLNMFQRGRINCDRRLGRSRNRSGCLLHPRTTTASASFRHERYSTILGVDGAVMAEEKISTDKCTAAFQTLERSLLGMRSLMSAAMLASTKGTIAKLTLVLLLWRRGTFLRG
jgi:hypothetical protein